jgi:hypothetical protein
MDLSEEYGVEIDLRSQKDELILQHDPLSQACFLEIGLSTSTIIH